MKASLNWSKSIGARSLSFTCTIDPIENAASILCVDCTEKITGRSGMSSGTPIA
jgi:hypothetical protein